MAPAHIRRNFHTCCLVQKTSSNYYDTFFKTTRQPITPHRPLTSPRPFHQEAVYLRGIFYNNIWTNEWCKPAFHSPQVFVTPSTSSHADLFRQQRHGKSLVAHAMA